MASTETNTPSLPAAAQRYSLGGTWEGQIAPTVRDEICADRAMLVEMLDRDPEAFSSGLDMQFAMQLCSGRY